MRSLRFSLSALALAALASLGFLFAGAAPAADIDPDPRRVILDGEGWQCSGPVDLDLLRVQRPGGNAVTIQAGCTGRIGRIEIDTWTADGIRVTRAAVGPLEIGGGYIRCHARAGSVHQDGIQAFGSNVAMRDLLIDCQTANNAALYITGGASGIVCDGCVLQPANSTLNVEAGTGPGNRVVNSTVCEGRARTSPGSQYLDEYRAVELPASDPACVSGAAAAPPDTTGTTPTDPPPPPVCDQACVDGYEQALAAAAARLTAARADLDEARFDLAAVTGERDRLAALIENAAAALRELLAE